MPFTLCDVESYPTNQPASTEPGKLVTGSLERVGAPMSTSLRRAAPTVSHSNRNPVPIPSPNPFPNSEPSTTHSPSPSPIPNPIPSPIPLPNPNQVAFISGATIFPLYLHYISTISPLCLHYVSTISPLCLHYISTISPLYQVAFISGALYFVEVAPPALGTWALTVFLRDEQLGPTVNVTAVCPAGQLPMPDGDSCGCAPGTILKPGAAALRAAGAWDAEEALCEACAGVRWSELGAGGCAHCAAGYYLVPAAPNGSASCAPCPAFAVCPAYTTIETLQLRSGLGIGLG